MTHQTETDETDEQRADREATEADHARGDHTYCGITCEVEMPTEHLRNFVIAKGYPGTKGALDELLRRARAEGAVSAAVAPPTDPTHGLSVQHADALYDAIATPGPARESFDDQHARVCAVVRQILDDLLPTPAEPTDRAAVLHEVADELTRKANKLTERVHDLAYFVAKDRLREAEILDREATELRRMADETATETPDDRRMHACTQFGTWFDRSVCAEPCGAMHTRCTECGVALDACPQQPAAGARQDQTATDEPERCAHCTHPKRDHDGRADHRAKHSPLVAGDPWCHACNAQCDYAAGARQDGAET